MFYAEKYPRLAVISYAEHLRLKKASNPPAALLLFLSPSAIN